MKIYDFHFQVIFQIVIKGAVVAVLLIVMYVK